MPRRKVVGSPRSSTQFRIAPARSKGSSSSRRRSSVGDGQIIGSLSSDLKVTVAGRLVPMGEASTMPRGRVAVKVRPHGRSEEHTSEIQSLMRNSYAVICLQKKTTQITLNKKDNTQTLRTTNK